LWTCEGHNGKWGVWSVCISEDGRLGISGGENKNGYTLRLWDLATGQCLWSKVHQQRIYSVSISKDSRWCLSGSVDGAIRLWDLKTSRCTRTFKKNLERVGCVYVNAKNWLALLSSRDRALHVWDLRTEPGPACPLMLSLPRTAAELSGQANIVRNAIKAVRSALNNGRPKDAYQEVNRTRQVAGYERNADLIQLSREIGLFGRRRGLRGAWFVRQLEGHEDSVNCVSVLENGRLVISGSSDGTVRIWELATGKCLHILKIPPGRRGQGIFALCTSEDGRWVLSGGRDTAIRLWNLSTGSCERIFEGHKNQVFSLSISRDNRWMLSGGWDETLRLWDLGQGKCIETFKKDMSRIYSVCFSDDSRWAICPGFGERVLIWDLADKKIISSFKGHMGSVKSIAISHDGRYLLCGIDSGGINTKNLYLWELATGECLWKLEGHPYYVPCVMISSDDQWFISAGDRTVRLWELATGRCLRVFEGHRDSVYSADMTRDCRWLVSGSRDKTIRVWELDWEFEIPNIAEWDEGAKRYLENFLILHSPIGENGVKRTGKPVWDQSDFDEFLKELRFRGYGWLRPEGVRKKLEEMTASWEGPPLDWDDAARPYIEKFLSLHCRKNWLGRWKKPEWNDEDFKKLLTDLHVSGYGRLRPEGVRRKLEEMAGNWQGPPPFPG
jgi:WD40 repeat protein